MENMNKIKALEKLADSRKGYLLTSEVLKSGISKPTLAKFVQNKKMERVGHGIFVSEDTWYDELYILGIQNSRIIYSHETALQLHGLMEHESNTVNVTVPTGYNATHLRKRGLNVHQAKAELYEMGLSYKETNYGNMVQLYDKERTICDIIKNKENMDIQIFQHVLKEYMQSQGKNLHQLMFYARKMKLESVVRNYTEVML